MTTGLAPMADRLRAALPDYGRLAERAAVMGLIEFDGGHWLKDPQFRAAAVEHADTDAPRVKFLALKRWLDRADVLENLDIDHGRTAVEFLLLVVNLTDSRTPLAKLAASADQDNARLIVSMMAVAFGQDTHPGKPRVDVPSDLRQAIGSAVFGEGADGDRADVEAVHEVDGCQVAVLSGEPRAVFACLCEQFTNTRDYPLTEAGAAAWHNSL